jgi:type I restriction enzyme S subunit
MYEGPEHEYIYPDLMMRVRLENELLARYLVYFLNSTTARNYFIKRATGTAGNMPKINGETVRELEVPVPPPNELAEVLQAVDDLSEQTASMETTLDAELVRSTRLRQAVLKRAFEGKLG